MASIRERNGSFSVEIRKKDNSLCATFTNRQTAELWAKYKEDLIDEMKSFDVPVKELITLEVAIDLKVEILFKENKDKRTIDEVRGTKNFFSEWLDWDLNKITYEILLDKCNDMLGSTVRIGGSTKNDTGRMVMQAPKTVLKKFRVLAAIYSCMIQQGMNIENTPQKVCAYIRTKIEDGYRG